MTSDRDRTPKTNHGVLEGQNKRGTARDNAMEKKKTKSYLSFRVEGVEAVLHKGYPAVDRESREDDRCQHLEGEDVEGRWQSAKPGVPGRT